MICPRCGHDNVPGNDVCAILTQKDIKGLKIDATTLASSSARRTLASGVVQVYDHVIQIVPDPAIKPALEVQKSTFVQVLSCGSNLSWQKLR